MTPDRLYELRSKVEHGHNLLASEAREVFEHYREPVGPKRKRCEACGGDMVTTSFSHILGMTITLPCLMCNGTGYKVTT